MQVSLLCLQAVQSLVPDLFRGSYAYETICKVSNLLCHSNMITPAVSVSCQYVVAADSACDC